MFRGVFKAWRDVLRASIINTNIYMFSKYGLFPYWWSVWDLSKVSDNLQVVKDKNWRNSVEHTCLPQLGGNVFGQKGNIANDNCMYQFLNPHHYSCSVISKQLVMIWCAQESTQWNHQWKSLKAGLDEWGSLPVSTFNHSGCIP